MVASFAATVFGIDGTTTAGTISEVTPAVSKIVMCSGSATAFTAGTTLQAAYTCD